MEFPHFVVALLMLVVFWLVPNILDPVKWQDPFALPKLAVNNDLIAIQHMEEGIITSPESMAMDKSNGLVYTSLADGTVVALDANGNIIKQVFFTYAAVNKNLEENEVSSKLNYCKQQAAAGNIQWNVHQERACGRPLGLRIKSIRHQKLLFILDAYHGLFTVDITHHTDIGETIHLLTPSQQVYPSDDKNATVDDVVYLPPKFYNDLDVTSDGTVYFTDSSYKNTRSENRREVLDAAPRGRLFTFKPDKFKGDNKLRVLLCGLHFPNGVQLLSKSYFTSDNTVLVAEAARFRILQVDVSSSSRLHRSNDHLQSCREDGSLRQLLGAKAAPVSVFIDELPGFLDNIRVDNTNPDRYFVGIGAPSIQPFSLLHWAYQRILIRQVVGKLVPMKLVEHLVPKYGLFVEFNKNGEVVRIPQDPTGRTPLISEVQRHPVTKQLWFGSHSNRYIGIL